MKVKPMIKRAAVDRHPNLTRVDKRLLKNFKIKPCRVKLDKFRILKLFVKSLDREKMKEKKQQICRGRKLQPSKLETAPKPQASPKSQGISSLSRKPLIAQKCNPKSKTPHKTQAAKPKSKTLCVTQAENPKSKTVHKTQAAKPKSKTVRETQAAKPKSKTVHKTQAAKPKSKTLCETQAAKPKSKTVRETQAAKPKSKTVRETQAAKPKSKTPHKTQAAKPKSKTLCETQAAKPKSKTVRETQAAKPKSKTPHKTQAAKPKSKTRCVIKAENSKIKTDNVTKSSSSTKSENNNSLKKTKRKSESNIHESQKSKKLKLESIKNVIANKMNTQVPARSRGRPPKNKCLISESKTANKKMLQQKSEPSNTINSYKNRIKKITDSKTCKNLKSSKTSKLFTPSITTKQNKSCKKSNLDTFFPKTNESNCVVFTKSEVSDTNNDIVALEIGELSNDNTSNSNLKLNTLRKFNKYHDINNKTNSKKVKNPAINNNNSKKLPKSKNQVNNKVSAVKFNGIKKTLKISEKKKINSNGKSKLSTSKFNMKTEPTNEVVTKEIVVNNKLKLKISKQINDNKININQAQQYLKNKKSSINVIKKMKPIVKRTASIKCLKCSVLYYPTNVLKKHTCKISSEKSLNGNQIISNDPNILPEINKRNSKEITTEISKIIEKSLCQLCNLEFKDNNDLKKHYVLYHHTTELKVSELSVRKFACENCQSRFSMKKSLELHIINNHMTKTQLYQCHICFTICERDYIQNHVSYHKIHLTCSNCSVEFKTKNELIQHLSISHNNIAMQPTMYIIEPIYYTDDLKICCICTLSNCNDLKEHIIFHHGLCSICNQVFKTKEEQLIHEKLHYPECIIQCELCNFKFGNFEYLSKHSENKHKIKIIKYEDINKVNEDVETNSDDKKTNYVTVCMYCDTYHDDELSLIQHHKQIHCVVKCKNCKLGFFMDPDGKETTVCSACVDSEVLILEEYGKGD